MKNNEIMINNVYGARCFDIHNANLNNANDNMPNALSNGVFCNTDVSTKYADRQFYLQNGKNVLIRTHYKLDSTGIPVPMSLEEVLKDLISPDCNIVDLLYNDFLDTQLYGCILPVKGKIYNCTGPVQYLIGTNRIDSNIVSFQNHSPFRNPKDTVKSETDSYGNKIEVHEEKKQTSIGRNNVIDRAFYIQSFSVTPYNLNSLAPILKGDKFKGFKRDSYRWFKKASLSSISLLNSRAKSGCMDACSIFIEIMEGSYYTISDVASFIKASVNHSDNKVDVNFTHLNFLNNVDDIKSIAIYYNSTLVNIIQEFNKVKLIDVSKGINIIYEEL